MQQNDVSSRYYRITQNLIFSEFEHFGHRARKHLDLKSVEKADTFWGIVPKGESRSAMREEGRGYVVPADALLEV